MLRFNNIALAELEDLEQDLHDKDEEREDSIYSQKINVYEKMYHILRKLVREKKEDQSYLDRVTKKLVFNLIHYGTYLKIQYEKDDHLAIYCLEKALKVDQRNPMAAYRLGFLSYKHRDYHKALQNFQKALDHQKYYDDKTYLLNEKQLFNAHLYLTNSALYVAKKAHEEMIKLPYQSEQGLAIYEFSSLYESLKNNEDYLENHAFYKVTQDGSTTCSKEECEKFITNEPLNTIVLYFSDRDIKVAFNENVTTLSPNRGDILRYLLTKSSRDNPATRITLMHLFPYSINVGEVNKNTFIQAISRLKTQLVRSEFPAFIQTTNIRGEIAYYFDQTLPFIVLYRVDEEIKYLS